MSKITSQGLCLSCNEQLYDYEVSLYADIFKLTFCDNKACLRYKLVTLQEDV